MPRFRNPETGRYINSYVFSLLLQQNKAKFIDAYGKRLRGKKQEFIIIERKKESERTQINRETAYKERKQRERVTGKKIEKPEKLVIQTVITKKGAIEKPEGETETYIRFSYKTRRESGSDGPSGRNALVVKGKISFEEMLNMVQFYYGWIKLGVKEDILSGELILLEGGVHYQQQIRDIFGFRYVIPGSEIRYDGDELLNL